MALAHMNADALNVLIQIGLVDVVNVSEADVTVRLARSICEETSTSGLQRTNSVGPGYSRPC